MLVTITPRIADRLIKAGKPVEIRSKYDERAEVVFVKRDRWTITTANGEVFDRTDIQLVIE